MGPAGESLAANLTAACLQAAAFNSANEQTLITPASGSRPTTQLYDNNGNLTNVNAGGVLTTQTWNPENKLVELVSPLASENYVCSDDGFRTKENTASGVALFSYDEMLVLLETTPTGILQARNTDYPAEYGGLASQNRGGASSFYGFDSNWSTRILISAGGLITDSFSYRVFGEQLQTGSGTANPHTYVGQHRYRHQTNGFHLVGQRVFDPFTGQFTSSDPIGFAGGDWNPRGYVGNNPQRWSDPTGLTSTPWWERGNYSAECKELAPRVHPECEGNGCDKLNQACQCPEMLKRYAANIACFYLRLARDTACGFYDNGHNGQRQIVLNTADNCLDKLKTFCSGDGPFQPIPVFEWLTDPALVTHRPWTNPINIHIPAWAWNALEWILFLGGIAAITGICLTQPELCPFVLPFLKLAQPGYAF